MTTTERLHPALSRYVRVTPDGKALTHPLVEVQPYSRAWNGLYNRRYEDKLLAVQRAQSAGNFAGIIWLYERRFRPDALKKLEPLLTDGQYWRMVSAIWLDAEAISPKQLIWKGLWLSKRAGRDCVMTGEEHRRLAELGDAAGRVSIFRGCGEARAIQGLSWTLDYDVAMAFARRHSPALLASATVAKADIQAYFERDNEVVVLPRHCDDLTVNELPGNA